MRLHKSKAQAPLQIPKKLLVQHRFVTGQVTLEMAIALIGVMALLFATINVFIWVNKRLVMRQRDYENTRVAAGNAPMTSTAAEIQVDETWYSKLYIFEGWKKK